MRQGKLIIVALVVVLLLAGGMSALGQCQGKTGFALQACQVASATGGSTSGAGIPPALLAGSKEPALTTGLLDAIHLDTLPGSVEPKEFSPLLKLDRADDGSFILKAGMFEAYVQGFSLEPNDSGNNRPAGFYPASIRGKRAAPITAVLKFSELHPDVSQNDIQQLLWAIVAGTDLEKMPPTVQQTAVKILPHDVAVSLQGQVQADEAKKNLMNWLNKKIAKNPTLSSGLGAGQSVANFVHPSAGDNGAAAGLKDAGNPGLPVERGVWAQMPGGFFVRYLPDGCAKIRLQVIVPDAAVSQAVHALMFDPTQFLALYTQAPALRLGISLRAAK